MKLQFIFLMSNSHILTKTFRIQTILVLDGKVGYGQVRGLRGLQPSYFLFDADHTWPLVEIAYDYKSA